MCAALNFQEELCGWELHIEMFIYDNTRQQILLGSWQQY